jgi:lysophospholipase L1-like esterase
MHIKSVLSNKPIDKENIDIKGLAEYYGIPFINVHPDFEQSGVGISSLYADGLHPNENGYPIILNKILPIISE